MEANEAPKKIYLPYKDNKLIGLVKTEGVKFNSGVDGHIEYIRKDTFIEKAVEFLNYKIKKGGYLCDSYIKQVKEEFIENFRKYMEGE